jgi:hypothetical protein
LAKSKFNEVPHFAVFNNLLSLYPSSGQIFSSAPSIYVPLSMSETKFNIHTKQQITLFIFLVIILDRLCGLVIRVLGYRSGGPGSIPGITRKKK